MKIYFAILSLLVSILLPVFVLAADPVNPVDEQVRVSAQRLEADEKEQTVVFSGKVQARKANMTIYADKMTLLFNKDNREEIDRVEIDGRLRIVQEDRIATADHGVFYNSEGRILLSGNAEVHQGNNRIVGDEIEYYLDESRSVVKSQPDSRVNAIFSTGGTEK